MPKPENIIGKGFDKHPENINRNGRTRGFKGLTKALRDAIELEGTMKITNAIEIDENGIETGRVFKNAKVRIPKKEMIILAAVKKSAKGDMRAIEFIFDRIDGKVRQSIEIEGRQQMQIVFQNASEKYRFDENGNSIENDTDNDSISQD